MIYIFEGMDNCLKDTMIQLVRAHLSPETQILKFSSPPSAISMPEDWQKAHFQDMFNLIEMSLANSPRNMILNRAHLGEYVYSPIYRGYEGNWIFDLEESFLNASDEHESRIRLFVLYDSNNYQLSNREDGKSLSNTNHAKMNLERERFKLAFEKSKIPFKRLFNLSDYRTEKNLSGRVDLNLLLSSMLDL